MRQLDEGEQCKNTGVILYDCYAPAIFAYLYRQGVGPQDAEDVVVEVFMAALSYSKFLTTSHLRAGRRSEGTMNFLDDITPEELKSENEPILDFLRQAYTVYVAPLEQSQVLASARERILSSDQTKVAEGDIWSASIIPSSPGIYVGESESTNYGGSIFKLDPVTRKLLWRYHAGIVEAAPTVINNVVYSASQGGSIFALKATDGSLLWSYTIGQDYGYWFTISPIVANGVLSMTVHNNKADNYLYALDAKKGSLLWRCYVKGYLSAPVVQGGVVYGSVGNGDGITSPVTSTLFALNADGGALLWHTQEQGAFSTPYVANDVVYVSSLKRPAATSTLAPLPAGTGRIEAFNAMTGARLWVSGTLGDGKVTSITPPVVQGDSIYVATAGYASLTLNGNAIYALSASNGLQRWVYAAKSNVNITPVIAYGTVFFGESVNKGASSIVALNSADGFLKWRQRVLDFFNLPFTVVGNVVYDGTDRYIYALDASSGSQLWLDADNAGNGFLNNLCMTVIL